MTKVSKTNQLILAWLKGMTDMTSTVRLVEFDQANGAKLMVNPAEVASVGVDNKGKVSILFRSGAWHTARVSRQARGIGHGQPSGMGR